MPIAPGAVPIVVLFARSEVEAVTAAGPNLLAALVPNNAQWDDFSSNLRVSLLIIRNGLVDSRMSIRLLFENVAQTAGHLVDMFNKRGNTFPVDTVDETFCSILPDVLDYRDIVAAVGYGPAIHLLRTIKDAVLLRLGDGDFASSRLADSREFHMGALRGTGFTALRRGAKYLRQTTVPEVDDAAINFAMRAKLPIATNPYFLTFNFTGDDLFSDRAMVLIGRNGTGKTQLLASIVNGLKHAEAGSVKVAAHAHLRPQPLYKRVLVISSATSDPYPRVIPPWEGIDYEYFNILAAPDGGDDGSLAALAACIRDDGYRFDDEVSRFDLLAALLQSLNLWNGLNVPIKDSPNGARDLFGGRIRVHEEQNYLPFRRRNEQHDIALVQQLDWGKEPKILTETGSIRCLSSGERVMFRFAAYVTASIEAGSLLLLDEPETHLHPNFISEMMDILQDILAKTRSVAIMATHSAYVVREVSRKRVRLLTLESEEIRIDEPRLQTFGANVDSISQYVFGDNRVGHRFRETIVRWVDDQPADLTIDAVIGKHGAELNPETLSFIAGLIRARTIAP